MATREPSTLKRVANTVLGFAASVVSSLVPPRLPANPPVVSVVIATYNRAANLRLAIESVLRQSYPHLEVLVVGDGCSDNTAETVAMIDDSRVRWIERVDNSGSQSLPNNDGIAAARGTYVFYLGHDDIWFPRHVATLVSAMASENLDCASTRCVQVGPRGSNVLNISGPNWTPVTEIRCPPSSFGHRRGLVDLCGPWKQCDTLPRDVPPDAEFIERAISHSTQIRALRPMTVIKLNAAWRKDSYIIQDTSEQSRWLARSKRPWLWVALIGLTAIANTLWRRPETLPTDNLELLPGEHLVDGWRRVKGLTSRHSGHQS